MNTYSPGPFNTDAAAALAVPTIEQDQPPMSAYIDGINAALEESMMILDKIGAQVFGLNIGDASNQSPLSPSCMIGRIQLAEDNARLVRVAITEVARRLGA